MQLTPALLKKAMTVSVEALGGAAPVVTRRIGTLFELVEVPGTAFVMGSGRSARWVGVTDGLMGKRLVDEGLWRRFMGRTRIETERLALMRQLGIDPAKVPPSHPVRLVSARGDVPEFLARLNEDQVVKAAGLELKLPSEAFWERAAIGRGAVDLGPLMQREKIGATEGAVRGFVEGRFHHYLILPAHELPEVGARILTIEDALPVLLSRARDQRVLAYRVCGTNSGRAVPREAWFGGKGSPAAVGGADREDSLGIQDMAGNLRQWTNDGWDDILAGADFAVNPCRPLAGRRYQVVRGGSFDDGPDDVRAAFRFDHNPVFPYFNIGLRLFAVPMTL